MHDVKWIKITTDVFNNWKIKLIKKMPEGHTLVCIWFELLCMAGSCNENGLIILGNRIVANEEMIAGIFEEDVSLVKIALRIFQEYGMIEIEDGGEIQISNWTEYQSAEGLEAIKKYERERKQKARARQKSLELKDKNVPDNVPDKSMDKSTDSSLSISNSKSNSKSNNKDNYILLDTLMSEEKGYKNRDFILNHEGFLDAIKTWLSYKKELKDPYKTERGLQMCLSEMVNQANARSVDDVIFAINYAISREWKGIYYEKIPYAKKTQSTTIPGSDLLDGIIF